jgi:hypothetical protein
MSPRCGSGCRPERVSGNKARVRPNGRGMDTDQAQGQVRLALIRTQVDELENGSLLWRCAKESGHSRRQ